MAPHGLALAGQLADTERLLAYAWLRRGTGARGAPGGATRAPQDQITRDIDTLMQAYTLACMRA